MVRLVGWPLVGVVVGIWAGVSGCGEAAVHGETDELVSISSTLGAYCHAHVVGTGTVDVENHYLPRVVACENGNGGMESLKAQAIAARSYLYYKLDTSGSILNGEADQVYGCGIPPLAKHYKAVQETAGQVLRYKGTQVAAFYVNGAIPSQSSCYAASWDPDWNGVQHYVTYNWGRTGDWVTQTDLGWVEPGYHANRGCMSQHGANCLADQGWNDRDILRFFYGADIEIALATGNCVDPSLDPDDFSEEAAPVAVPDSCWGACGHQTPSGCWCDKQCAAQGDCCEDACLECDACAAPTPPPAPPQPPAISPTSCEGSCGEEASGGCWCDTACLEMGDCCEDSCTQCGVCEPEPPVISPTSCEGSCGIQVSGGCWCDLECVEMGDCCDDSCSQCGACEPAPSPISATSCEGSCGAQATGGCWCDGLCASYGDCCHDVCQQCAEGCPGT